MIEKLDSAVHVIVWVDPDVNSSICALGYRNFSTSTAYGKDLYLSDQEAYSRRVVKFVNQHTPYRLPDNECFHPKKQLTNIRCVNIF